MTCELSLTGPGRHLLAGELCIQDAADLKPELLGILVQGADCEIDLSQVSEVDSAGVQLLLMLRREAEQRGCGLSFVNHSAVALEVIQLLNLSTALSQPTPAHAKDLRA